VLNEDAGNVHIQPVSLSAATYIGNASTVASTDLSVMDYLASGATTPLDFESIGQSQPMQLSQFWVLGSGTLVPRFTQI
jgi:hypothetical protein